MPTFRGGILDLDGVVVDSEALHLKATNIVFDSYGLPPADGGDVAYIGRTDRDIFTEVIERFAPGRLSVDEMLLKKHEVYGAIADQMEIVPGVLDFIRSIAGSDLRLGLATSSVRLNQSRAFDLFSLAPFFDAIVTADDVRLTKPDPEPYLLAAERLKLQPSDCFVVEDSFNGVRSAKGAGCHVIGLTTSFPAARLVEAGADRTASTFEELYAYLGIRRC